MEILNHDELIKIRSYAKSQNKPFNKAFMISPDSADGKAYKKGMDKDGLTVEQRAKVDEFKDRLTYGIEEEDLW